MVSQPYKDLAAGVWASGADADRQTPEDAGLVREDGFPVGYEQPGSGDSPEREVFNQRGLEHDAALVDIAATGVPAWDVEVDYRPVADAACFVTTPTGLHLTRVDTGPTFGNATDPDAPGQTVWRPY